MEKKEKEIRKKAIDIVKTSKNIVETLVSDIEEKKSFEELFPENKPNFDIIEEKYRKFNLDLFDNTDEYYKDLYEYFSSHINTLFQSRRKDIIKFDSSFATIYFSLLTDFLLDILEKDKQAYLDDIIKFDITAICEIFSEKNERLIYSDSFFLVCINELKEKYSNYLNNNSFNKNNFIIKMDKYYKEKAEKKLNNVKSMLYMYIQQGFYSYAHFYIIQNTKKMDASELDIYEEKCTSIKSLYQELIENDKLNKDLKELKSFCLKEENKKYFIEFSKYLSEKLFNHQNEYEKILDEFVLPFNILEIELDDDNSRIIYNLKYNENAYPGDYFYYGETFYQQFLKKK